MRAAAEGASTSGWGAPATAGAAAALLLGALFFSDGSSDDPLVWIGGLALVAAALGAGAATIRLVPLPRLSWAALAFLGCLAGLVLWMGLSIVWSTEPSRSWGYTNRTLVYLAFACLGVLVGGLVPRAPRAVAGGLAALLGLVFVWALAAKSIPSLYPDYERVARLRSPVGYWNELALLGDVAVGLALWVAAPRQRRAVVRATGTALLYVVLLGVLLTYSRFGIAFAVLVAVLWLLLDPDRVEGLAALLLGGVPALGVFLFALTLPGISDDGVSHARRAHDGWRFGLVALAGGVLVWLAAAAAGRAEERRPLQPELRARIERLALWAGGAGAVACIALAVVFAGHIWDAFTKPQTVNSAGRLGQLGSSNRWTWWQQAWHAFAGHPLGGTGAATFGLTNRLHRSSEFDIGIEPHNVPLQFLSELGIVGLVLLLGTMAVAGVGIARARVRAREDAAAVTALAVGLAAWLLHLLLDMDWNYVAVCGPLLFAAGALLAVPGGERVARRRPLLAAGAVAFALVAVYSLASPWLARRELSSSLTALVHRDVPAALADAKTAHSYDPLSTDALTQWADLEDLAGHEVRARELYRRAVSTEPLNPTTWYELGVFEYRQRNWLAAYRALDRSWGLDRHGPAAVRCGYLDRVRVRVKHYGLKCPRSGPAASP